jgi:hypothetical protein
VWALSQLLPPNEFASLASRAAPAEIDASVKAEWHLV